MTTSTCYDSDYSEGWDCDPGAVLLVEPYDEGLDETDDEGDWQVLALDRFGDRAVNGELLSPRWHH